MSKIPNEMLIHSCVYKEYLGMDRYNTKSYADEVTLNNVRLDLSTQFTTNGFNKEVIANGVLFFFVKQSNVNQAIDSVNGSIFKEQSEVTFNGKTYTVNKVIPVYEPFQNVVHHYELELI